MLPGYLSLASLRPLWAAMLPHHTHRMHEAQMRQGLARADGVATDAGKVRAARALRDETRWQVARRTPEFELAAARYDGFTQIEDVLTQDQIAAIDAEIGPPREVAS